MLGQAVSGWLGGAETLGEYSSQIIPGDLAGGMCCVGNGRCQGRTINSGRIESGRTGVVQIDGGGQPVGSLKRRNTIAGKGSVRSDMLREEEDGA